MARGRPPKPTVDKENFDPEAVEPYPGNGPVKVRKARPGELEEYRRRQDQRRPAGGHTLPPWRRSFPTKSNEHKGNEDVSPDSNATTRERKD
jgi:hypothetical protein